MILYVKAFVELYELSLPFCQDSLLEKLPY